MLGVLPDESGTFKNEDRASSENPDLKGRLALKSWKSKMSPGLEEKLGVIFGYLRKNSEAKSELNGIVGSKLGDRTKKVYGSPSGEETLED